MSWAHVGAGRPGLDPGVGGCGNAGKCASLGDQGHGGGGAVSCEAAAASQGCHPHPHTSHPSKGETGAEVAKWSGAGHGDREVRRQGGKEAERKGGKEAGRKGGRKEGRQ